MADPLLAKQGARRIQTFPYWTSNPFVQMLYAEAAARDFIVTGNANTGLTIAALRNPDATGLIHLQWPSPVTDEATDATDAEHRVDEFLAAVHTAKTNGRPLLWTVHNSLPHDSGHIFAARRLHQGLADAADVIHVLRAATADAVSNDYLIDPERTVVIPHSSYHGVYGRRLPKSEARKALDVPEGPITVLFFGHLRPYKGLHSLFDALRVVKANGTDMRLLLAGKPSGDIAKEVDALQSEGIAVTSALRFIDDDEVATWFSAADVAVLPYERILNSGTMHLAGTYGVPVILPGEPHLIADFGIEDWVRFFDAADAAHSIAELLISSWFLDRHVSESAVRHARTFTPSAMSRTFADLADRMLEAQ